MDGLDAGRIKSPFGDGGVPRVVGYGSQGSGPTHCFVEGAVTVRNIFGREEFRIDLVLKVVNDADGRNVRFEIGWRRKRTKQQVGIEIPQYRSGPASLQKSQPCG